MASPLPILSDVTQQFIDLQSKLEKLVPSLGGVIKALSTLTESFGSLSSGAEKAASSLEKATTGLEKLAEAADSLDKLTNKAKKLEEASSRAGGLQPSILSQVGSFLKGLPGRATAPGVSDAIGTWSAPLEYAKSAKEAMSKRSEAADEGEGPEVPWSFTAAQESMERFEASLEGVKMSLLTGLAPALGVAGDMLADVLGWVQPLTDVLSQHGDVVEIVAAVVLPFAGVLFGLAKAIELVAFVTEMWGAAQKLLNVIMADNPIGLVLMAVVAIGAAIIYAYNHFEQFRGTVEGVVAVVKLLWEYCKAAFGLIGQLMEAMVSPTKLLSESFREGIAKSFDQLKNMPGVAVTFEQAKAGAITSMRADKKWDEELKAQNKPFSLEGHNLDESEWQSRLKHPNAPQLEWPGATPGLGVSSPRARASASMPATGNNITVHIAQLGTTTFNVESLDKKHAVAMRDHVREALVAALQDATAPSPALA